MAEEVRARNLDKLESDLGEILAMLTEPDTEDVYVNETGEVWHNVRGRDPRNATTFDSDRVRNIINSVAALNNTVVNADKPILEAILPFGDARFEGIVPPVVSAPVIAIRTKPTSVFSLEDYARSGILDGGHCDFLKDAILRRENILIVGGTGAGKTTLLNACLRYIAESCPTDRIVSIEDTTELRCSSVNYVALHATGGVTMRDCLRASLRLRPKRIIVGEVRGGEALDLLKAWNTGHPGGVATVHANSAESGLLRIEALAREATDAPQAKFIAQTINVVVYITATRQTPGRRVTQVAQVLGVSSLREGSQYVTQKIEEGNSR